MRELLLEVEGRVFYTAIAATFLSLLMVAATGCEPGDFVDYDGDLAGCWGGCKNQMVLCFNREAVELEVCANACVDLETQSLDELCAKDCVVDHARGEAACYGRAGDCIQYCIAEAEAEIR